MNGPTPSISSILNSTADRSPIRRSRCPDESEELINPPPPCPVATGKSHPPLILGGSVELQPHKFCAAKPRALASGATISTSCQILHEYHPAAQPTRQRPQSQGTTRGTRVVGRVPRERQKKSGLWPLRDVRPSSHSLCASSNRIPLTGLYTDDNHVLFSGSTSRTRHYYPRSLDLSGSPHTRVGTAPTCAVRATGAIAGILWTIARIGAASHRAPAP